MGHLLHTTHHALAKTASCTPASHADAQVGTCFGGLRHGSSQGHLCKTILVDVFQSFQKTLVSLSNSSCVAVGRENKIISLENENERCLHFTYCHTLQQEAGHHEIQQVSVPAGELNAMKKAMSNEMSQLGSSGRLSILPPSSANVWEQPRCPQTGEELSQGCGRASITPHAHAVGGKFCVVLSHLCPWLAFGSCSSLGLCYSYKASSVPCLGCSVFSRDGKEEGVRCVSPVLGEEGVWANTNQANAKTLLQPVWCERGCRVQFLHG